MNQAKVAGMRPTHEPAKLLNQKGLGPMRMQRQTSSPTLRHHLRALLALPAAASIAMLWAGLAIAAPKGPAKQRLFATPDAAVQALAKAAKAADQDELTRIFGPDRDKLLSGDPVEDKNALQRFAANLEKSATVQKVDDSKFVVLVGEDHWPSPIPIVAEGRKWRFDTATGLDEILNRRIGHNELSAIMTCRAYVIAQWEYFTEARDTAKDGLAVFARRLISTPGQRDGLFWETAESAKPSPLGSLVAEARAEGYGPGAEKPSGASKRAPFHGYYFKILTAQGPHAPGGKFSYLINGNMIAGHALIAFPDKWGNSGVMTFIVNGQGRIYEKNLGPDTAQLATAITEYDPDPTWKLVTEP